MTAFSSLPARLGAAERALLLRLCAVHAPPDPPIRADVDWPAVLDYIAVMLSPLAAHGIAAGRAGTGVPSWVLARLDATQRALAVTHLRRQAGLRSVLAALSRAEIPALLLKGAALATLVYSHPILRPMADVDLWIPPDRLDDAVAACAPLEFAYSSLAAMSGPAAARPDRASTRRLALPHDALVLELHGHPASLDGVPWASFPTAWDASLSATLGGVPTRVLCPEHTLTHVCLHLGRGTTYGSGLLRLVDVALVVKRWRDRWNWLRLVDEWRDQRIKTWMLLGVTLARDLLGAPLPRDLEAQFPEVPTPQWSALRAIALERTWSARTQGVPAAMGALVRLPQRERVPWLRRRFVDHYWRSAMPRPAWEVLRGAAARAWFDLRVRVPRYVRAFRRGVLWGSGLARGIALERERAELERLVLTAGDLGGPPELPAEQPLNSDRAILL